MHGADLQLEAPILEAMLPFDYLSNVRSVNNLKILYFHYQKTYGQQTWQGTNLSGKIQRTQMLKLSPTSCLVLFFLLVAVFG